MASHFKTGSAAGVLSILQENEVKLKVYALKKLNLIVDQTWAEVANYLSTLEKLSSDQDFPERNLAAFIASKVFYHLQEYDYAVKLALEAGDKFDLYDRSQYVETVISKIIDTYISDRKKIALGDGDVVIEKKLADVVEIMFERCFNDQTYEQAIGIAIESHRLDIVEKALVVDSEGIQRRIMYTYGIAQNAVYHKDFKNEILELLVKVYESNASSLDYQSLTKCQFFLNVPEATGAVLSKLIEDDDKYLLAYQICFDLLENENQLFLSVVIQNLNSTHPARVENATQILNGTIARKLNLLFLKKSNHADMIVIKDIKEKVGEKNSITHGSAVWANAMMNCCTTNDAFINNNLSWVAKATNWSRFTATSTLGLIHTGNSKDCMSVLDPYLSGVGAAQGANATSPYSTSGAYYAYGLIHANQHSREATDFMINGFRNSGNSEVIQHGICLGLGLVSMATSDDNVFQELNNVLCSDSAVAGEAAAIGMGLVRLGTADENSIQSLLNYANDTQHEKIIRAAGMALALIMYGKEDGADTLINQLLNSKDAILRYGGMFTIGLAYAGTEKNEAIKQLLHVAVSDVSDDVRRAAVINIGFLLFKKPDRIPEILNLLAESYNPHVRYGVAMAIGIGCAGTGLVSTLKILLPLVQDKVDYVRQGALIAMGMVFIQTTEKQEPKIKKIKELYEKIYTNKREGSLTKMGALIGNSILEAAGRNATITLTSRAGNNKMASIVGLALFTHHWYWYPCLNMLSLSLSTTAFIGVNKDLKVPKSFEYLSRAQPSLYKYPKLLTPEDKEEKKKDKIKTVVLSTTDKVKRKEKKKAAEKGEDVSMVEEGNKDDPVIEDEGEEKKGEDEKKEEEGPEPDFQTMVNPARVLKQQEAVIAMIEGARYVPVVQNAKAGFVLLHDTQEGADETFYDDEEIDPNAPNPGQADTLKIPEPFDFDPAIQNAQ